MKSLNGKISIVTGAASGIGEAIARLFASCGSKVVAADVNRQSLDAVCASIAGDGGTVMGVTTDVAVPEQLQDLVSKTLERFGTIDILVNNAGVMDNFTTLGELDMETWERVMGVNVKGPTILSQLAVKYWLQNDRPGVIVNMASVGGMFGARGGVSYVTSKHALIGLTKNVASVYRSNNIRCNAVSPGGVKTGIGDTLTNPDMKGLKAMNEYVAASPVGDPMQVANVVAFLASDESAFVNGAVVTVDGGWTVA